MALRLRDLVRVLRPASLIFCLVPLVFLSFVGTARGDGLIYVPEKVPATIPYQRALIVFDEGKETLVLQSKYSLPAQGAGKDATAVASASTSTTAALGWVVPVPAVPELDSMPADAASRLFSDLSHDSAPDVTSLFGILPGLLMALSLLGMLAYPLSSFSLVPRWIRAHRLGVFDLALWGLFVSVLWMLLVPNHLGAPSAGLDVIQEQRVGIYDVKVIQSSDSSKLIEWLNGNSFVFGDADRAVFDHYIRDGWCFVVARVNPTVVAESTAAVKANGQPQRSVVSEGLMAPLILRFPHASPVYPLALTAVGGHKTQILLYLVTKTKMACGGRLPLRYAESEWTPSELSPDSQEALSTQIPGVTGDSSFVLTKFRGTLTPAQMREDLTFAPAPDNEYFREWVIRW